MQFGLWSCLLVFGGGACLVLGVVHVLVSWRLEARRDQLWLGCLGVLTAGKAVLEAALYASPDVATYGVTMKWQLATTFVWSAALIGYIQAYVGEFRRLRVAAWLGIAAVLVVNLALPHGLVFTRVESLRAATLPWGEVISIGQGPISSARWLLDAAGAVIAAFCIASCARAFTTKSRAEALLLSGGCAVILLLALGHGWLVDLGAVDLPYLVTPAVFAFIGVFSVTLARRVVESVRLAKETTAQERRWRSLLSDVKLLVVSTSEQHQLEFVNPEFCRVSGHTSDQLLGRDVFELAPARERERQRELFDRAPRDQRPTSWEATLVSRTGLERIILWSSIFLRDVDDRPTGRLCLGFDVTEQRQAEEARDAALHEAEGLRRKIEHEILCLNEDSPQHPGDGRIIGESDAIKYVRHKIHQVATTEATVLIQGETGVGKELVAAAIHAASKRRDRKFVQLDCGAVPVTLFETELFGHRAGAFTDARSDRVGRFELAEGGTLFLDEVGELPPEVQPKLLRALQTGEFERVGSSETRHGDVRIIAATHRDLTAEVAAGRFRSDLYYRLNVFPLTVPPLRARREDLPLLVEHFVPRLASRVGTSVSEVPGALLAELSDYDWPGNIRELINVLERAIISSGGGTLRLAERLEPTTPPDRADAARAPVRLDDIIRRHIEAVLEATRGRISGPDGAAAVLGLNPSTLRGRMRKLGMRRTGS